MIKKIALQTFALFTLTLSSSSLAASPIEELILLCKGGMNTKQVFEVTGKIEGDVLKIAESKLSVDGSLKQAGSISQYDLIQQVQSGVTEDLYKYDIKSYRLCVERMAPAVLGVKAKIADQTFVINNTRKDGLVKVPLRTSQKNRMAIAMSLQYIRYVDSSLVIAVKLKSSQASKNTDFGLGKGSALLVGEDSGEEYKLKAIKGLQNQDSPEVSVPPKGSKLVKFQFETPQENEPLTFSTSWSVFVPGLMGNTIGMSITFGMKPLNITWIDIISGNYKYSGPPNEQNNTLYMNTPPP